MLPHIETSQLICFANQLTGFYMRAALAFNGLMPDEIRSSESMRFNLCYVNLNCCTN